MERDVRWLVCHHLVLHVVLDDTVLQGVTFKLTVQQRWQRL